MLNIDQHVNLRVHQLLKQLSHQKITLLPQQLKQHHQKTLLPLHPMSHHQKGHPHQQHVKSHHQNPHQRAGARGLAYRKINLIVHRIPMVPTMAALTRVRCSTANPTVCGRIIRGLRGMSIQAGVHGSKEKNLLQKTAPRPTSQEQIHQPI